MRKPVAVLLLFLAWHGQAAGPEAEFWEWFAANAQRLASSPDAAETGDEMSYWLGRIEPGLSCQIVGGGRKTVLVLSADGSMGLFPVVDRLIGQAPRIKGWKVQSLRKRQDRLTPVTVGGVTLDPARVNFDLYEDGFRYGVVLYVPQPVDDHMDDYRTAARRLMSQSIGEREVGAWIGFVDVDRYGVRDMQFSQPFSRFREVFEGLPK